MYGPFQWYLTESVSNSVVKLAPLAAGRGVKVLGWAAYNSGGAGAFLQLFNAKAASDVTLGTTRPTVPSIYLPTTQEVVFTNEQIVQIFNLGVFMAVTATEFGSGAPGAAVNVWIAGMSDYSA